MGAADEAMKGVKAKEDIRTANLLSKHAEFEQSHKASISTTQPDVALNTDLEVNTE